jgi:hypothetical protein
MAQLNERVADRVAGVALAHSGQTKGQRVLGPFQEPAACQLPQLAYQRRGQRARIQCLEGFAGWNLRARRKRVILRCSRASASISSTSRTSCSVVRMSWSRNSRSLPTNAYNSILSALCLLAVMVCILAKGFGDVAPHPNTMTFLFARFC